MNGEMFEKIVSARADEAAKARILKFKRAVNAALCDLVSDAGCTAITGSAWAPKNPSEPNGEKRRVTFYTGIARATLKVMASDDINSCWPEELWAREIEKAKDALLRSLGDFQHAFAVAESKREPTPGEVDGAAD